MNFNDPAGLAKQAPGARWHTYEYLVYLDSPRTERGPEEEQGGGGVRGSIYFADDAKQLLKDAFYRWTNCARKFGGEAAVNAYASGMLFMDGRGDGNMNAAVGPHNITFAAFRGSRPTVWASTLLTRSNGILRPSKTVVLWSDFFGNVAGGHPRPREDQQATLMHEFIHSYKGWESHKQMVEKLEILKNDGETDTAAVDRWIKDNCGANTK